MKYIYKYRQNKCCGLSPGSLRKCELKIFLPDNLKTNTINFCFSSELKVYTNIKYKNVAVM